MQRRDLNAPDTHPPVAAYTHAIEVSGAARTLYAPDYPMGGEVDATDPYTTILTEPDAVEQGFDMLGIIAPSVASDDAFRAWWDMAGNRAASPSMARAVIKIIRHSDVRDTLPRITAPTLILHRDNPGFSPVGQAHYLAEHISGSRLVELPGEDALYWVGDTARLALALYRFALDRLLLGQGRRDDPAVDHGLAVEHGDPVHQVFELTDIARPGIGLQPLEARGIQRLGR